MKYDCKYFKTDFQHFLIFILLSWSELFLNISKTWMDGNVMSWITMKYNSGDTYVQNWPEVLLSCLLHLPLEEKTIKQIIQQILKWCIKNDNLKPL